MTARRSPDEVGRDPDGSPVVAFAVELKAEFATPAHRHVRGQMIGCSRGVVTIATDAGSWIVPAGHAVWLPPEQSHAGRSFGPGAGWSLYLAPEACRTLPPAPRTVVVPPLLREAILRAASWSDENMDAARGRIADLIVHEIGGLPAEQLELSLPQEPRLRRIAAALLVQPADCRSVDAWAAWAGTTARTISRRFPRETGLGFAEWRSRARLMRALEMLADGLPVTIIALDLGYHSVGGFIARFRRTFGVTPTAHPIHRARG